jgi:putative tricarboxylic transport membrane protein
MRAADTISSLFWLAVGAFVTWSGWDLRLGTLVDPGPGFMIFWVGLIMTLLSALAFGFALREPAGAGLAALWKDARWYYIPYIAVLLAIYAYALPWLGFPLVTIALLLILFRTVEPQGWVASIAAALIITAASWLVFARWLGTQLPLGALWVG